MLPPHRPRPFASRPIKFYVTGTLENMGNVPRFSESELLPRICMAQPPDPGRSPGTNRTQSSYTRNQPFSNPYRLAACS